MHKGWVLATEYRRLLSDQIIFDEFIINSGTDFNLIIS